MLQNDVCLQKSASIQPRTSPPKFAKFSIGQRRAVLAGAPLGHVLGEVVQRVLGEGHVEEAHAVRVAQVVADRAVAEPQRPQHAVLCGKLLGQFFDSK